MTGSGNGSCPKWAVSVNDEGTDWPTDIQPENSHSFENVALMLLARMYLCFRHMPFLATCGERNKKMLVYGRIESNAMQ